MGETRHRTTIDIGVDDRQVKRLGKELERALGGNVSKDFERAMTRSNRQIEKLVGQTQKLGKMMERMGRDQAKHQQRAAKAAKRGAGGRYGGFFGTQFGPVGRAASRTNSIAQQMGGRAPVSEGFTGGLMGMIPYVGSFLQSTIQSAQQYYQQYAGYATQRAGVAGTAGGATRFRGGIGLGIGLPAQAQMLGQMAGTSGRRGSGLTDIAPELARYDRVMGFKQAGAITGAFETGGGGQRANAMQETRDMIATGLARGVREAKIDQYLQMTAQFAEQARMGGIQLEPSSITRLALALPGGAASGFGGRAGVQAALSMAGGLRGAAKGTDAFSFLAMRAAGFTGQEGGASYGEARARLEESPEQVMPRILEMINARGGDRDARAAFLEQGMKNMGVSLSWRQARALADIDPARLTPEAIDQAMSQAREQESGLRTSRSQSMRGVIAPAATASRMEATRLGIGEAVAPAVTRIMEAEQQIVREFLPAAMSLVQGTMNAATQLINAYKSGGMSALASEFLSMTLDSGVEVEVDPSVSRGLASGLDAIRERGDFFRSGNPAVDAAVDSALEWMSETARGNAEATEAMQNRATERGLQPPPSQGGDSVSATGPTSDARSAIRAIREAARRLEQGTIGLERSMGIDEGDMASA